MGTTYWMRNCDYIVQMNRMITHIAQNPFDDLFEEYCNGTDMGRLTDVLTFATKLIKHNVMMSLFIENNGSEINELYDTIREKIYREIMPIIMNEPTTTDDRIMSFTINRDSFLAELYF